MSYSRYALYAVPDGDLGDFGAVWLGWDIRSGAAADPLPIAGLDDVTMTPRKYGFHGTIKPPFRLADGYDLGAMQTAVADLAAKVAPVHVEGLQLSLLGGFLALVPVGEATALSTLAARFVQDLDRFRAPPSEAELTRRRAAGLTARQERNLTTWGYPYVLEDFRFHLTLTGRLPPEAQAVWIDHATAHLPDQPLPYMMDSIGLAGERLDGRFELLHRYTLTG
jgi:hypothetical protein